MATLKQKMLAEWKARELLELEDLPAPDEIEYGETCVRLLWHEPKVALVVDIDPPPTEPCDEGQPDPNDDPLPDPDGKPVRDPEMSGFRSLDALFAQESGEQPPDVRDHPPAA